MIELYNGNCRAFLSNYNGPAFDAVITDPPYSSGTEACRRQWNRSPPPPEAGEGGRSVGKHKEHPQDATM